MFENLFFDLSIWSLLLFVAGIVLLIAEMFQPGFGVAGFSGISLLILDVVISARSLLHGIALALFLLGIMLALFIVFLVLMSAGALPAGLVLKIREDVRSGYVGATDYSRWVGYPGTAQTALRPSGTVRIDSETLSVVTEGEFIEKGAAVRVKRTVGNRIVVEREM